jgi:hypothetical protein
MGAYSSRDESTWGSKKSVRMGCGKQGEEIAQKSENQDKKEAINSKKYYLILTNLQYQCH